MDDSTKKLIKAVFNLLDKKAEEQAPKLEKWIEDRQSEPPPKKKKLRIINFWS